MHRQRACKKEAELPPAPNTHTHTYRWRRTAHTNTALTYTHTHTHTRCMFELLIQQTESTRRLFSPTLLLSLPYFAQTLFAGGGGGRLALRRGLILSYRLEPAPQGQLSANTRQPLSVYSAHSHTYSCAVRDIKATYTHTHTHRDACTSRALAVSTLTRNR